MLKALAFEKFFLPKIKKTDTCWLWAGSIRPNGYGLFKFKGKKYSAHRFAYELFKNEIPKDMHVCHTCDIRNCVNPDHLWLGTHLDNMRDKSIKGRQVTGEKNGKAKLTETQVLSIREKYATGEYTQPELGKEFNVSLITVSRILNKKAWKHI